MYVYRQQERSEQNEAFKASLAADQEKDRIREREQEEERRKQREKEEKEKEKQAELERISQNLKAEPPSDCKEPIIACKFRCPDRTIERRFLKSESLQGIIDFVHSLGFPKTHYMLNVTYPNRDVSDEVLLYQTQFNPFFTQLAEFDASRSIDSYNLGAKNAVIMVVPR